MVGAMERRDALRRRRAWTSLALLAPGLFLLLLLLLVPLAYLFRASFNEYDPFLLYRSAWTLENYQRFFTEGRNLRILLETMQYGLLVTGVTLVLGFPLAYWLARRVRRGRKLVLGLVVLPFTLNTAVLAFGWAVIMGQSGLINGLLLALGVVDEPIRIMFTATAVVIALTQALLPYQVLSLMAVIARISPALEEAAENLGASRFHVYRLVVLPLAVPGILAGSTFVFLATVTAFVTPRIIGGGEVQMIGTLIYQQIFQSVNWPFAAALSFILVVLTLASYIVANRLLRQNFLET